MKLLLTSNHVYWSRRHAATVIFIQYAGCQPKAKSRLCVVLLSGARLDWAYEEDMINEIQT